MAIFHLFSIFLLLLLISISLTCTAETKATEKNYKHQKYASEHNIKGYHSPESKQICILFTVIAGRDYRIVYQIVVGKDPHVSCDLPCEEK